jgi:ribosomal protein S6
MLVVKPDVEMTDKTAAALAQKLIGDVATISDLTLLGKKTLAYPLRKFTEASYVRATLAADTLKTSDLQKQTNSEENVLRFLLIQKEE